MARLSRQFYDRFGDELHARFAQQEVKLLKWMFAYWVTPLLAIAGLKLM